MSANEESSLRMRDKQETTNGPEVSNIKKLQLPQNETAKEFEGLKGESHAQGMVC